MANEDNGSNSNDPLRQYLIIPRINQPPSLFPLPEEHNDVTIPMPMTPSQFKNRLIFGSKKDSSLLVDALSQNPSSPSSSATTSFSDSLDLLIPPPEPSVLPVRKPKPAHHFHRSKTAPAMAAINDITHPHDQKTEQTGSKTIVRQAVALLVVYLSLGVLLYWLNRDSYNVIQTHPVVDALYFCIVTMCTIGYGDITPDSVLTKLFSILFVLVGFGFIDILLSGMVTYVLDLQENYMLEAARNDSLDDREKARSYIIDIKKGRMRIRLKVGLALGVVVLCVGFGVLIMHFVEEIGWFDSFYFSVMSVTTVGKAEYVIYKLKKMEKITDKDINPIGNQFDKLDRTNSGRITLLDLLETSTDDLSTATSV
ncbi:PREDICTED: two-pore potassium channel 2-like [Camelina sativa]|uniref:Two-pore potassium channel 2-like n=1 Tax=Camelina sativa TaxID=90675 RepID=A0ABM0USY2_CAMSA|nr:PREDICTED: two-pore potassium channel 2-like [Camelina sativa]